MCDRGELCRANGRWKGRHVKLRADEFIQISDCSDGCAFIFSKSDAKEFFCAENNLYSIESHILRLARQLRHDQSFTSMPLRQRWMVQVRRHGAGDELRWLLAGDAGVLLEVGIVAGGVVAAEVCAAALFAG